MTDYKNEALWILPTYAIAIYFFRVYGFLIWTVVVVAILVGSSAKESETSATQQRSKPKKVRRDEVPTIEYSDLIVTRIAPKKKRKWEKKIARYSRYDRKR